MFLTPKPPAFLGVQTLSRATKHLNKYLCQTSRNIFLCQCAQWGVLAVRMIPWNMWLVNRGLERVGEVLSFRIGSEPKYHLVAGMRWWAVWLEREAVLGFGEIQTQLSEDQQPWKLLMWRPLEVANHSRLLWALLPCWGWLLKDVVCILQTCGGRSCLMGCCSSLLAWFRLVTLLRRSATMIKRYIIEVEWTHHLFALDPGKMKPSVAQKDHIWAFVNIYNVIYLCKSRKLGFALMNECRNSQACAPGS